MALSVTESTPVRAPVLIGIKPTLIVHAPFTAKDAGQLLVCGNSALVAIPLTFRGADPKFLRATALVLVTVPIGAVPKLSAG